MTDEEKNIVLESLLKFKELMTKNETKKPEGVPVRRDEFELLMGMIEERQPTSINLSAKQVGELAEWIGESVEKRKRSLFSDALKRQGIEAVPDDREVNILAGRRFEKDMEKTLKQEAEEWAADFWDDTNYIGETEMSRSAGAIGFMSGHDAAQPRWISVKERLPEEGFYLVFHPKLGVTLGMYAKGSRTDFWYMVSPDLIGCVEPIEFNKTPTHWMPLPAAPEGEE